MKRVNYQAFMAVNPIEIARVRNQIGQKVIFFENPFRGNAEIYGTIGKNAFMTDFWDMESFIEGSDQLPVLTNLGVFPYTEIEEFMSPQNAES